MNRIRIIGRQKVAEKNFEIHFRKCSNVVIFGHRHIRCSMFPLRGIGWRFTQSTIQKQPPNKPKIIFIQIFQPHWRVNGMEEANWTSSTGKISVTSNYLNPSNEMRVHRRNECALRTLMATTILKYAIFWVSSLVFCILKAKKPIAEFIRRKTSRVIKMFKLYPLPFDGWVVWRDKTQWPIK